MALRTQQLFAGIAFGGAIATALAVAVPQLIASQPAPVIAEIAAAPEAVPVDSSNTEESAVDMNHWQETSGRPPSPYIPGPRRKK